MATIMNAGKEPANQKKMNPRTKRKYIWAYVFLFPQFIFFLGVSLYPIIMSYIYSFFHWEGFGPLERFIGLDNYIELFQSQQFWQDLMHTLVYMVGTTAVGVFFALVLAIILNDPKFKGKAIYRVAYFLPVVTNTAIIGIIMNNLFGGSGFVNTFLMSIHVIDQPVHWLTKSVLAMMVLVAVGTWKGLGVTMVYWLAGLQSISEDLYESAQIDGAGFWRTLFHITLPLLKPIAAVIVLFSFVTGIHAFDLVKTLTDGGPYFSTETLDLYIYNYAFSNVNSGVARMGYASAAGVVLGIVGFAISLIFGGIGFSAGRKKKTKKGEVAASDHQ